MAAGTIIRAWQDSQNTYLAVSVNEGVNGTVEYIGSVPTASLSGLTAAQQKAALIAAAKAVRDAQQPTQAAVAGLTGAVTI
jgi:uncharacterized protein with NAD-binding domain and iron-sulfur cluster